MIDQRLTSNFNWLFFLVCIGIAILGVVSIYSANHGRPEAFFRGLYIKQIYWIGYGLIAMLIALALDYRWFSRYAYLIYFLTLLALAYVLISGVIVSGSRRWLHIGSISIQVSEFAKVSLIIALAKYFESGKMSGQYTLKDLFVPTLMTGALGGLIVVQPDLGTTMMIFFIFLVFVVAIEMETATLVKLFSGGLLLAPAVWFFLQDYQKSRLLTLF
ncbi:MAG: FtsW/RodA/SpoVE family cell cycle protein, partial [Nitrospina sp.]|nr:FtsW/RodA/SpoVE family cell cycle protein [Nitrospina sp.]